jgi:hypothetical protein
MAEALILEFDGVGVEEYERVNGELGIDMRSGEGDWPAGLLMHTGAAKPGGFMVFELWASKDEQERFMEGRLATALRQGGIEGPPARVEWLDLVAHHDLDT